MKVRVRDFQSIKDVEIEVDGFTVITGPNNSGKTALIRALRGAFQNTAGTGFVRHGEDACRVEVDMGDASFAWEKGHKIKPTYEVGGKSLNPGRDIPEEISDLGVKPVVAGGREIWPQIANQFNGQVFLVDQPGSVLAEAVADVERVGKLNRALKAAEKDKRAASSELKVRKKDLKTYEEELETFDGVDDVEALVALCEASEQRVEKIRRAVTGLKDLKGRLDSAAHIVDGLSGVRTGFKSLDATDKNVAKCDELLGEIAELRSLRDRHTTALSDFESAKQAYDSAGGVSLPTTAKLEKVAKGISVFRDLSDKRVAAYNQVEDLKASVSDAEADLKRLTDEIETTLGELGNCPVCGTDTHHPDSSAPIEVSAVGGVQ